MQIWQNEYKHLAAATTTAGDVFSWVNLCVCVCVCVCVCIIMTKWVMCVSVFFSVFMVCLLCGQIFPCDNILTMQDICHDTKTQSSGGRMATC